MIFAYANGVQAHYIWVLPHLKHDLNLAQSPHRIDFICERIVDLLNSHTISVSFVDCLPDDAIITPAHLLDHFVFCLHIGTYIVNLLCV